MSVILRTNQLTKRYAHRTVVDHLSMTIHEGDIYGFIGKKRSREDHLCQAPVPAVRTHRGQNLPSTAWTSEIIATRITSLCFRWYFRISACFPSP